MFTRMKGNGNLKKGIKNYTSKVPPSTSMAKIEGILCGLGANRVIKDFDQDKGVFSAIMFEIPINDRNVVFRLPARIEACFKVLWQDVKRPGPNTKKNKMEQAEITSWKIILDWVEAQSALIQLEQADFQEVFLPYVYDPVSKKTLYQIAQEKGINQLLLS